MSYPEYSITVHLSSRGWGDFSSVNWTGDRETPTAMIVAACQKLLAEGYDVDQRNQTDEAIAAKIEDAKRKSIEREQAQSATAAELTATEVPQNAICAYQACSGNPENFPDDIDDPRYWLVRHYAAAIEQQGLAGKATLIKLAEKLRESVIEEAAQYQGEA